MRELFDTLTAVIWVADFAALCLFALIAMKQKTMSSSLMTAALIVLLSGVIIQFQSTVDSLVAPGTSESTVLLWGIGFGCFDAVVAYLFYQHFQRIKVKHDVIGQALFIALASGYIVCLGYTQFAPLLFDMAGLSYTAWIIMAYYLGTALFNAFAVYAITRAHRMSHLVHSLIAKMYILAFSVAAILQIVRFNERYIWHTNYTADIYKWGLASINICTSLVTICIAMLAIYRFYSKKNYEGALWKI